MRNRLVVVVGVLAVVAAVVAYLISAATLPDASATGWLGVNPTEEPSAFRDAIRLRQQELLSGDDEEVAALLAGDQEVQVRMRPNLTYVEVLVHGSDEGEAIEAVDAIMVHLLVRNERERREAPQLAVDELQTALDDKEAELRLLGGQDDAESPSTADEVIAANRRGLVEAIANTRTELEAARNEVATTFTALEIIKPAEATSQRSQAWIAALAAFVGTLLVGSALGSFIPVGLASSTAGRGHGEEE